MDDRFFNGVIGCSSKVCGYKLKSLTPWHQLMLSALGSSVFDSEKTTTIDDLLLFLKVTQTEWPNLPDLRAKPRDFWWHWKLKKIKTLQREMDKFKEWLDIQLSSPKLWQDEDKDVKSQPSSPAIMMLVVDLVSTGGLSISEAWNMRISESQWFHTTLAELKGAKLKVAYETDKMPEKTTFTKEEMLEKAKADLSPEQFKAFKQSLERDKSK